MHELLAVAFTGTGAADEVLHRLRGLADDHRIGLDDACVAVRDPDGGLHLKQAIGDRIADTLPRRFWRDMVGHILHHGRPDAPAEGGTPVVGLDRRFVREVAGSLEPGTSALFIVVEPGANGALADVLASCNGRVLKAVLPDGERARLAAVLEPPSEHVPTAADLRALVAREEKEADRDREADRESKEAARRALVKQFREAPLTNGEIHALLRRVTDAARRGEVKVVAYRFPSDVCADGGRAINSAEPDWPNSLLGQPRALYDYWNSTLRPAGYHLSAEILDFPNGMPGDVGFLLSWAEPGLGGS